MLVKTNVLSGKQLKKCRHQASKPALKTTSIETNSIDVLFLFIIILFITYTVLSCLNDIACLKCITNTKVGS